MAINYEEARVVAEKLGEGLWVTYPTLDPYGDGEWCVMIRGMDDNPVMRIVLVDYPSEPSADVSQ